MKCVLLAAAVCLGGLLTGSAVTFTEISGSYELELGSSGNFKVVTDTTLTLTGAATDGVGTLGATFWIPDEAVTVTIDASGIEGLMTLDLTGHLRGAGKVLAGTGIAKVRYGKDPSDMKNIMHLPVLEAQLDVADQFGRVELVKGVSLFRMPEKGTIATGAVIAPFVAGIFDGSDKITLDAYDLMAVRPETFAPGCEITVKEGRALYCRPCSQSVSTPEEGSNWKGARDLTFEIDVVLDGGTFESHAATECNTIVGDFSGTGTLRHRGTADLAFRGKFTIDGTIACVPAKNGTTAISLYPEAGSDFSDTTVCLSTDVSTYPRAIKFMSAAEPLSLASLEADYRNDLNVLYLGAGVSLAIGTVTGAGYLAFDGAGGGATVSADDVSVPRVSVTPGVKFGFESCAVAPVVALAANGMASAWSVSGPSDRLIHLGEHPEDAGSVSLELGGWVLVDGFEKLSSLIVEKDADVTVWKSGTLPSVVNRGGALKFQDGWRSKAALWLDASVANTLSNAQAQVYAIGKTDEISADLVYEWLDCRDWCRDYRIRSVRYDLSTTVNGGVFAKSCSDEGGAYMSWWDMNRTRTTMAGPTYKGDSSMAPLAAKCVICVFGSQLGGGCAMFCEANARLARVADYTSKLTSWVPASTPICLDGSVSVRTNGVAVTGSETGFSGEWQIVTLTSETALSLTGIGHASSPNTGNGNGGQNYREIIAFTEMPSADEIRSVERYLAARWNLPYADAGSPSERTLTVSGSGTVTLDGDAQHGAAGYFTGTLDLNGHRYAIADGKLPIPAEEVPADGRLLWVDPRLEGAVVLSDDEQKPDEVKMIFTRDNAGLLTANGAFCMVSPYAVPAADADYDYNIADRRVRWTGDWLDFLNGYDETAGNMLAIQKLPKMEMTRFNDGGESIVVRGGFFAIDSSRGGGSLMLTVVSGSAGTANNLATRGPASPIWALGKGSTVSFDTYLDGTAVDGMTRGFSGRPEVMSFNVRDGASVTHKTTGYPDYTTKKVTNGEIVGEWLLYSEPLADADRENVEAYLMKKWLGRVRTGYTDPREMTVTGAGTLAVATGNLLPKLAAEFTGSIEVTGATWSFTLVQGAAKAKEAWACPGRTVTAPVAVTVSLDVSAARQGKFLLASAGTFAEGTTFTLGTVVNPRGRTVTLAREGNALYATVEPKGLMLIVK